MTANTGEHDDFHSGGNGVLPQLATGSVKITFGELRHLPAGTCSPIPAANTTPSSVTLPLQSSSGADQSRAAGPPSSAQKQVEVSEDISSPFDAHGRGSTFSTEDVRVRAPAAPAHAAANRAPHSRFARPVTAAPGSTAASRRRRRASTFTPRSTTPAVPSTPQPTAATTPWKRQRSWPAKPIPVHIPLAPVPPAAAQAPAHIAADVSSSLAALAENWPDASAAWKSTCPDLATPRCALPANLIEPALKRGRVIFVWRDLRSLDPTRPGRGFRPRRRGTGAAVESDRAAVFRAPEKRCNRSPAKIAVAEEIPNLFFGFPQPAAEPPVSDPPLATPPLATPPMPMPAAVAAEPFRFAGGHELISPGTAHAAGNHGFSNASATPATDFSSRGASPAEIVARAGIAGRGGRGGRPAGRPEGGRPDPGRNSTPTRWRRFCRRFLPASTSARANCAWAN